MRKYAHKLTRVSKNSLSLVIPAEIVKELKLKERQKMTIRRTGKKIIIEDWKK